MSTYGKLTVPTADIFKSQNNIASLENGKVPLSEIPMEAIKTSLSNSDLSVKSLNVTSEDGIYTGKIFQNYLTTEIASENGLSGIQLYSSANNKRVSEIIIGSTEGSDGGNIVLRSNNPSGYNIGEINITASDGNSIKLGDGNFKLSSINTETNEGSEINIAKDNITVAGAITTTIANNVQGEQITIGSDGITLDSKNVSDISLKNATNINLSALSGAINLSSSYITLTGVDSGGIVVLKGDNGKVSLANGEVSLTRGSNNQGLTFSQDTPMHLYGGSGKAWLMFLSDGSIDLASEEGVGRIMIQRSSLTTFQNNEFMFEPCSGVTDPVYIKVPVVNSTTNKLDGTYAKLYVSKSSTGTLELKVEAAS